MYLELEGTVKDINIQLHLESLFYNSDLPL